MAAVNSWAWRVVEQRVAADQGLQAGAADPAHASLPEIAFVA
jgi:hypothetical protein